ncbi:hypothetical protein Mapa_012626 [Marchantia paleacea]|nr:hypothetical protein Mapa_012626 [Marchantia paleacea]
MRIRNPHIHNSIGKSELFKSHLNFSSTSTEVELPSGGRTTRTLTVGTIQNYGIRHCSKCRESGSICPALNRRRGQGNEQGRCAVASAYFLNKFLEFGRSIHDIKTRVRKTTEIQNSTGITHSSRVLHLLLTELL